MKCFLRLLTCFAVLLSGRAALAADQQEPTTITLKVRPLATTRPALAQHLLPRLLDQTPGDAAPVYLLAATLWSRDSNNADKPAPAELVAKLHLPATEGEWFYSDAFLEAPLEKLKSPELDKFLGEQKSVLDMLDIASKRETCRWDLPFREQGFFTLLPHLQALRGAARANCVKARAYLADGEITMAIRTLRVNFALTRALNEQAVLIQSLVATAISAQSLQVLREVQQRADGVNLYWPLANLPHPMCDMATGMEWERAAFYFSIPSLRKVREGKFTDADWRETINLLTAVMQTSPHNPESIGAQMEKIGATMLLYAQARAYFLKKGMSKEELDAMPQSTTLGRYFVESMDEINDEMDKWTKLPFWQAHPGLMKVEEDFKKRRTNILMSLVPSLGRAMFSMRRLDRDVAAMQTVEALRDYAARNAGKLPATLEEIKETPAPIDPIWGKTFEYRVEGQRVTLRSAAPKGNGPKDELVVKVTFTK
jgi:hypothetical protein